MTVAMFLYLSRYSAIDLDLYNGPRSNVNMTIESIYITIYMMTKRCLSYMSSNLRYIRNLHLIDSTFTWAKDKCKYANEYDLIHDGNCNDFHICHHLRNIFAIITAILYIYIYIYIYMTIENRYIIWYVIELIIFALPPFTRYRQSKYV